jgi:hypothetical protein
LLEEKINEMEATRAKESALLQEMHAEKTAHAARAEHLAAGTQFTCFTST